MILATFLAFAFWQSPTTVGPGVTLGPKTTIGVTAGSVNAGDQFRSAGDDNALLPIASPFVTRSGTYTANHCFVYVGDTSSHTVDCGLYSSSSTNANTLLCHVSKTSTFTAGFVDIGALSGCGTLTASTLYFVASISSSGLAGTEEGTSNGSCPAGYDGSGNQLFGTFGTAQGSAVLPGSFGTNHAVTKCWSMYVSLICNAACGAANDEYFIINFDGSGAVNGNAPTTTNLNASVITSSGGLNFTNAAAARETYDTTAQLHNLLTSLTINGQTVTGSGTLGLTYLTGASPNAALVDLPGSASGSGSGGLNSVSLAEWFSTDLADNDTLGNAYSIFETRSVDTSSVACNPQILPDGTHLQMVLETNAGDATGSIQFTSGITYKLQTNYTTNGTNTVCQMAMYDTSGTQVGSTLSKTIAVANKPAGQLEIGVTGAEVETASKHIRQDNIVGSVYGTFPLPN
jgi:hypothetical protein